MTHHNQTKELVTWFLKSTAQGEETDIRADAMASFQQQPNWTIWFGKSEHPISLGSVHEGVLKSTMPRTAPAPR
jgi:hypothetical protein